MLRFAVLAIGVVAFASAGRADDAGRANNKGRVTVFAAASLQTALDEIAEKWRDQTGVRVRASYAGSAKLAVQIQQGAPADLFISAHARWMDVLARDGLIDQAGRRDLVSNQLVLIAHGTQTPEINIASGFGLRDALGNGRLAIGLVQSVPAGMYGKAALEHLGVWDDVSNRLAQTDNVRAALALVARREAPFGIVYRSDAAASQSVRIVGSFPSASHPRIAYPAAVVRGSRGASHARMLLDHLTAPEALEIFRRHGFTVPAGQQ